MIRLIRYEFIKQFCKRSILALFVVFSLANLFKIYGEYKSYSYLTDGNGERSISRGRAARFITFMLAAPSPPLPTGKCAVWLAATDRPQNCAMEEYRGEYERYLERLDGLFSAQSLKFTLLPLST
ncbi:MAG: hypothetical protein K1W20_11205 [Lachnospiraceae bacterium]